MFSLFSDVYFAVKSSQRKSFVFLTGKSFSKFGKTVYGKNFRKPFSKTRVPLLSLSSLFLCSLLSFLSRPTAAQPPLSLPCSPPCPTPPLEAVSSGSPAFANNISVLSEVALSSLICFSRLMWLTTVAWASRISLSVNLWWPVVGFVDFVVDFGWVVVVGGGFFLLIRVGFG